MKKARGIERKFLRDIATAKSVLQRYTNERRATPRGREGIEERRRIREETRSTKAFMEATKRRLEDAKNDVKQRAQELENRREEIDLLKWNRERSKYYHPCGNIYGIDEFGLWDCVGRWRP